VRAENHAAAKGADSSQSIKKKNAKTLMRASQAVRSFTPIPSEAEEPRG
jgi:hypothetical protein